MKRSLPDAPSARLVRCLLGALLLTGGCTQPTPGAPNEYGSSPDIGAPAHQWLPTLHIASVQGWGASGAPQPAPGLLVSALARGLVHPRWLYVLPNGDVLVAESGAPPRPDDDKGIKGAIGSLIMKMAGAGSAQNANRITLLRTVKSGGATTVERHVFLQGLNSPIGMALVGANFYVADTDAVLRYAYTDGATEIRTPGVQVVALPAGSLNHHWTKSLIASADGRKLYVGVGSNSNVGENGLAVESERAAVWEINPGTGEHRVFASGLRNPVGLAWEPQTGVLWAAVNERDELGDHLPPDYMTGLHEGGFYGWPFSYYGQHVDGRVAPQDPALVAQAIAPDYALGAHTASLGLCSADGSALPAPFTDGMFVGQHGSWNRKIHSGYKVIFVPFDHGKPSGTPIDVLTGFLSAKDKAFGRPVGVAIGKDGSLLVADDVGNAVWRVSGESAAESAPKVMAATMNIK